MSLSGMILLLPALVFALAATASSQPRVELFNVDASDYPTVRASLRARDTSGAPIRVLDRLRLADGHDTVGVRLDRPSDDAPAPLSIVLVNLVDTSTWDLRATVRTLVDHCELPTDEIAIIGGGVPVREALPFTRVRTSVTKTIGTLTALPALGLGPTLFDSARGALTLLRGRAGRRIVIVVTDVLQRPHDSLDTAVLWRRAMDDEIAIHSIVLGRREGSGLLGRVALRTGGLVADAIESEQDLVEGIARILTASRERPARVSWRSPTGCDPWRRPVALVDGAPALTTGGYAAPEHSRPKLRSRRVYVRVPDGRASIDTTFTLRAESSPVRVDAIVLDGDDGVFSLTSIPSTPRTMQPGDSLVIGLRASRPDSMYAFAHVSIVSNACFTTPLVLASSGAMRSMPPTAVEIVSPADGARVRSGDSLEIRWRVAARGDSVDVLARHERLPRWDTLARGQVGGSVEYTAPPIAGRATIVVAESARPAGRVEAQLPRWYPWQARLAMSPDGRRVAVGRDSLRVEVIDDSLRSRSYSLRNVEITDVDFSPDGRTIVTAQDDGVASIIDASSGETLWWIRVGSRLAGARFSPDGRWLLLRTGYNFQWESPRACDTSDTMLRVVDVASGRIVSAAAGFGIAPQFSDFAPDGRRFAVGGGDGIVTIHDALSGARLRSYRVSAIRRLHEMRFSPDGSELVTCDSHFVRRWDAETGDLLGTIDHGAFAFTADYSLDMRTIVSGGEGPPKNTDFIYFDRVKFWRRESGAHLLTVGAAEAAAFDVAIDPMRPRLVVGAPNGVAQVIGVDTRPPAVASVVVDVDAADLLFETPLMDVGARRLGDTSVHIFTGMLCNRGSAPAVVRGWSGAGTDVADLTVLSPAAGALLAAGECHDVTLRVVPRRVGAITATLRLEVDERSMGADVAVTGAVREGFISTIDRADIGTVRRLDTTVAIIEGALRNDGGEPVRVEALTIVGDGAFVLDAPSSPFVIGPGETADLHVRLIPTRLGSHVARIRVAGTGDRVDPAITIVAWAVDVDGGEGAALSVSPNPASDRVRLDIGVTRDSIAGIDLIDPLGRAFTVDALLEDRGGMTRTELDLAGLGAGAWLVRIRLRDGIDITGRLVVR